MERWVLLRKGADFEAISKKFHISPRLASLIRNRDVIGDEAINQYLNDTIAELYDGMQMKGMPQAVEILTEKIRDREKIRVIGDYDCDGINATYILLEGLEKLGAKVDSDIPDRIKDGYGLNQHLIDRAHEDGIDTIITCDNGIAAAKEIEYGKALGMTSRTRKMKREEDTFYRRQMQLLTQGRKDVNIHLKDYVVQRLHTSL